MLPWLTMTPLGAEVEPDVYCRYARVEGSGFVGFHLDKEFESTSSRLIQCSVGIRPPWETCSRNMEMIWVVLSAPMEQASVAMPCKRAVLCLRRNASGGGIGTAISPAYKAPQNACTKSSPGGYTRSRRSPGVNRDCRYPAIERALASRSPYVRTVSQVTPSRRKT